MINQRFDRLLVLSQAPTVISAGGRKRKYFNCICDCGNTKVVMADALKYGMSRSCGCLKTEVLEDRLLEHGYNRQGKRTKTYTCWANMKARCTNPKYPQWEYYGGRGITVCERWMDFKNFLEDMGESPDGLSIDRVDNDGNYEPGNCVWATKKQQTANRRAWGTA